MVHALAMLTTALVLGIYGSALRLKDDKDYWFYMVLSCAAIIGCVLMFGE